MATRRVWSILLLSLLLLGSSFAETLSDFENAVTTPKPEPVSSNTHSRSHHSDRHNRDDRYHEDHSLTSELIDILFVAPMKWLTDDLWAKADEENEDLISELDHELGTPYLPYLRFDYRQQYLDSDLGAEDLLLEAGYKYGALYGRYTQYEGAADESLDIQQYYGMLRISDFNDPSPAAIFSAGIGVGGYSIHGQQRHGGPALTVPIAFYPEDWYGIEFRPAWARINERTISDYDISLSVGEKFAHLRLGYRWLWVQGNGHWLDGPYAGLTFSF